MDGGSNTSQSQTPTTFSSVMQEQKQSNPSWWSRVMSPFEKATQFGLGVLKHDVENLQQGNIELESFNPVTRFKQYYEQGKQGISEELSGKKLFEDTLGIQEPQSRTGKYAKGLAEFGTEVVADPTTYIPMGFADDLLIKPVKALGRKVGELGGGELGKMFISGFGVPKDFYTEFRKMGKVIDYKTSNIIDEVGKQFYKVDKDSINNLADVLDKGVEPINGKVKTLSVQIKGGLDDIYDDLVERGLAKEEFRKDFYFPHQFEKYLKKDPAKWAEFKPIKNFTPGFLKQRTGVEGWIKDVPQVIARYRVQAEKKMQLNDLISNTVDSFGKKLSEVNEPVKSFVNPKTQEELFEIGGKQYKKVSKNIGGEDLVLESAVADEFNKFIKGDTRSTFGKAFDKVQNVWKGQATAGYVVPNPGYMARNVLGNFWNNFLGGVVNPLDYAKAGKEQLFKGENYQKLKELGMFGDNLAYQGVEKVLDTKLSGSKLKKFLGAVLNFPHDISSIMENNAKLAHAINKLEKGASVDDAINSANKYIFDYSDLTDWEKKWGKRVIPFYAWMRKNVPLQVEELVKQPKKFAGLEKATRGRTVEDQLGDNAPDWMKKDLYIRNPLFPGTEENPRFWNPYMPFQDLKTLLKPVETLTDGISPFVKVPAELRMNKSLFFKTEITNEKLPKNAQLKDKAFYIWDNLLKPRGVNEWINLTNKEKDAATRVMNYFGFKNYVIDTAKQKDSNEYQDYLQKTAEKAYEKREAKRKETGLGKLLGGFRGQEAQEYYAPSLDIPTTEPSKKASSYDALREKYGMK